MAVVVPSVAESMLTVVPNDMIWFKFNAKRPVTRYSFDHCIQNYDDVIMMWYIIMEVWF